MLHTYKLVKVLDKHKHWKTVNSKMCESKSLMKNNCTYNILKREFESHSKSSLFQMPSQQNIVKVNNISTID